MTNFLSLYNLDQEEILINHSSIDVVKPLRSGGSILWLNDGQKIEVTESVQDIKRSLYSIEAK